MIEILPGLGTPNEVPPLLVSRFKINKGNRMSTQLSTAINSGEGTQVPLARPKLELHAEELESATATRILAWAIEKFGRKLAICTSFQLEGMVILDLSVRISPSVRVFTLDTGRLPEESYRIIEEIRNRYGVAVETVLPDAAEVQTMVSQHGPNLFFEEPAKRLLCCHIRKTLPLERKLQQLGAYVVGLRRSQTQSRASVRKVDESRVPVKISPLADWSKQDVEEYTRRHDLPVHALYRKGYTSIGCGPCTRSVRPGEDERAGRWWWEDDSRKECGMHFCGSGERERTRFDVLVSEIVNRAQVG